MWVLWYQSFSPLRATTTAGQGRAGPGAPVGATVGTKISTGVVDVVVLVVADCNSNSSSNARCCEWPPICRKLPRMSLLSVSCTCCCPCAPSTKDVFLVMWKLALWSNGLGVPTPSSNFSSMVRVSFVVVVVASTEGRKPGLGNYHPELYNNNNKPDRPSVCSCWYTTHETDIRKKLPMIGDPTSSKLN